MLTIPLTCCYHHHHIHDHNHHLVNDIHVAWESAHDLRDRVGIEEPDKCTGELEWMHRTSGRECVELWEHHSLWIGRCILNWIDSFAINYSTTFSNNSQQRCMQVGRMGCIPAHGGNGNSRNVSCSKPSLHCRKRPWEGALYKWLTRSASDATHMALYKWSTEVKQVKSQRVILY